MIWKIRREGEEARSLCDDELSLNTEEESGESSQLKRRGCWRNGGKELGGCGGKSGG